MRFLLMVTLISAASSALAYPEFTHRVMSERAAVRSRLGGSTLYSDWGIRGALDTIRFPRATGGTESIFGLISQGADDEDSLSEARPLMHFFDPTAAGEAGLSVCFAPPLTSSPDWAIKGLGQAEGANYSYANARKAMELAFKSETKTEREKNFALLFESLGHVLHHIQDMAQPQHVRNDIHLGLFDTPTDQYIERRSRYEAYAQELLTSIPTAGYDNVRFARPLDYWKFQGKGMAEYTNRNFVSQNANFEARNDGAVVSNSKYPNPVPVGTRTRLFEQLIREDQGVCPGITEESKKPFCFLRGDVDFIFSNVSDLRTGGALVENPRAAAYSIFNQDLELSGVPASIFDVCGTSKTTYKLIATNRFTFPYAMGFLTPRAVGYSAGMLDYFFRGKIDLHPHETIPGKLVFANQGDDALSGTVRLYYDGDDGYRREVQGGSWLVSSLQPGYVIELNASQILPPQAFPARQYGVYTMVFTGTMGEEVPMDGSPGAVIAKVVKLPAPEFYWSQNYENSFKLSFKLPNALPGKLDDQIKNNFASSQLKVNGVPVPLGGLESSSVCLPGSTFVSQRLYGPPTGEVMQAPGNVAYYTNYNGVTNLSGSADDFYDYRYGPVYSSTDGHLVQYGIPDAYVYCSNYVHVTGLATGQIVGVEYLVAGQSIFKFCAQIEDTPTPPPPGQENMNNKRLVIWAIQNARVIDGAVSIRNVQALSSCPGQ